MKEHSQEATQLSDDLVVFDLDGTLVDSLGDLADAMNAVLKELGHSTHARDAYRYMVGEGIANLVRRALPLESSDDSEVAEVVQLMRQEYATRWTATTRPFPGIPQLIDQLRAQRVFTAVLSNKPDDATREIVSELFMDGDFDIIRGALDGVPLKPDPTSALAIVSELGQDSRNTMIVGDTAIDMATGANAGMVAVGVTWGFRDAEELEAHGADHIVQRPLDILDILERCKV
jgi:phosphoglycolate phosphatase